jgi:hypothetical protein
MSKNSSKDRASRCTFTFSDGRQCRLPRYTTEPDFCYFHAQKMAKRLDAAAAGKQIAKYLNADFLTACDLNNTFGALFSAAVQGYIKPKAVGSLACLGQLMLRTHLLAKEEFQEAFDDDTWLATIRLPFSDSVDEPPSPALSAPDNTDSSADGSVELAASPDAAANSGSDSVVEITKDDSSS